MIENYNKTGTRCTLWPPSLARCSFLLSAPNSLPGTRWPTLNGALRQYEHVEGFWGTMASGQQDRQGVAVAERPCRCTRHSCGKTSCRSSALHSRTGIRVMPSPPCVSWRSGGSFCLDGCARASTSRRCCHGCAPQWRRGHRLRRVHRCTPGCTRGCLCWAMLRWSNCAFSHLVVWVFVDAY